jgi:ribonuclease HI
MRYQTAPGSDQRLLRGRPSTESRQCSLRPKAGAIVRLRWGRWVIASTRKRKLDDSFGSMRERGTSAGDGSGPKTRYHLLATDGGIVAEQPGKAAGEAAIGVVLKSPLEEISEPIGSAKDQHVAEYRALIRGLEAARSHGIGHLRVCLDSALLVNQLNGRWKVKAEHLKPLHKQAVSLIQQFAEIKITWVPRKANAEADALASTPLGPLRPKPKPSIDELPLE